MTRTVRCHLNGLSPKQLVGKHEEAHEFGGTFICNGIERVIRMLQIPKRNQIMAIERSSFRKRGPNYSQKACVSRYIYISFKIKYQYTNTHTHTRLYHNITIIHR